VSDRFADDVSADIRVVSEVSAVVGPEQEDEFLARFREMVALPRPDGLLRTELLRGSDGEWRIQTMWRGLDPLAAARVTPLPPSERNSAVWGKSGALRAPRII